MKSEVPRLSFENILLSGAVDNFVFLTMLFREAGKNAVSSLFSALLAFTAEMDQLCFSV